MEVVKECICSTFPCRHHIIQLVETMEAEVERLNSVLDQIPLELRTKAEEQAG